MSYVNADFVVFQQDFSGGFLDSPEPDAISPAASPDAANCQFARIDESPLRVSLKKRDGFRMVTPAAMTLGKTVDGMAEFRRAGQNNVLLAGCNGSLYQYDNVSTMALLVAGFTAGNPMRFAFMRNQCLVTDGTQMKRIDAALAVYNVGQIAPTAAPGLAVGTAAGVTGTYEGYVVWYDPTADHESSPSATSVQVAFANTKRLWTKPAGAPGASYTQWRPYVRRVDTNEVNFYRTASFPIASATAEEAVSDTARRNIGPFPGDNDPPPVFAILAVWRNYCIGVLPNGTDLWFSKLNNFQNWDVDDVFPIGGGRAEIRAVRVVGETIVIQTGTQSFTLEGDRVPFRVVELNGSYGSVSQESCGYVDTMLFGWDEQKGPYATNGSQWKRLAVNRIAETVATANPSQLPKIRCEYAAAQHLVLWAFPVGSSSRLRTIIAYDHTIDKWLPPITGIEVGAMARFNNTATGDFGFYVGDAWGRIYEAFAQDADGIPPATTAQGVVTTATPSTVTVAGASFYTGGDGLAGLPVAVLSPSGQWQWRRIQSNTSSVLTLDTTNDAPWTTTPIPGGDPWIVVVGGIRWYWTTPWIDFGRADRYKRGGYFTLMGKTVGSTDKVEVRIRLNDNPSDSSGRDFGFPAGDGGDTWGNAIWGVSLWGSVPRQVRKQRIRRSFFTIQVLFQNFYAHQPIELTGYGIEADALPRRRVGGIA